MKKTNNKGFSLIELIIVIAIMAILVAIIAPNLTKYLGKSKKNTDKKNADEIASQVQTSISDYESQENASALLSNGGNTKFKWTTNGLANNSGTTDVIGSDPSGNAVTEKFKDILDSNITSSTKSKETNNYAEVEITKNSSGKYTITVTVGNESATK